MHLKIKVIYPFNYSIIYKGIMKKCIIIFCNANSPIVITKKKNSEYKKLK